MKINNTLYILNNIILYLQGVSVAFVRVNNLYYAVLLNYIIIISINYCRVNNKFILLYIIVFEL